MNSPLLLRRVLVAVGILLLVGALIALAAGQPPSTWLDLLFMGLFWLQLPWQLSRCLSFRQQPDQPGTQPVVEIQSESPRKAEQTLVVDYQLSARDLFRFRVARHRFAGRVAWVSAALLFAMGHHVLVAEHGQVTASDGPLLLLSLTILAAALAVVWFCLRCFWGEADRASAERASGRMEISPEGVYSATREERRRLLWSEVTRIQATRDHLCLDVKLSTAWTYVIPRRAFGSPESAEAFLRAAQEWRAAATGTGVSTCSAALPSRQSRHGQRLATHGGRGLNADVKAGHPDVRDQQWSLLICIGQIQPDQPLTVTRAEPSEVRKPLPSATIRTTSRTSSSPTSAGGKPRPARK